MRILLLFLPFLLMACANDAPVSDLRPVESSSSSAASIPSASSVSSAPSSIRLQQIDLVQGDQRLSLQAEIAATPGERATGLMHRTFLPEDRGMLFIFEEPTELRFWMKNTLIPLDILFFDTEGVFVSRTRMEPCAGDPCPTYPSEGMAKYALEVNPGVVAEGRWSLQKGF